MVQHRDEATARAGRQFSKSIESGVSISASGKDVMHAEMYVIRLRRRVVS